MSRVQRRDDMFTQDASLEKRVAALEQALRTANDNQAAKDYGIRSSIVITGGGNINVNADSIRWSQRFILISAGNDPATAVSGYFDVNMPAVGSVITGVGGHANVTVTATGIALGSFGALYYILPTNGAAASQIANFRVVSYSSALQIPSNWVRIAHYDSDDGKIYVTGRGRMGDWDYDSGWLADSNASGGIRTYSHGLALDTIPEIFELWFSAEGTYWYPVGVSGMATTDVAGTTASQYRNPGFVRLNANSLEIGVYSGIPLWSSYTGTGWVNYASGYWRFRIKK